MAIQQAICNSFKKELLEGAMNFKQTGGDTYKIALYISTATLNSATTNYTATIAQLVKYLILVNILKAAEL